MNERIKKSLNCSGVRTEKKMIHRKWSLLTGPVAILGGIVASLVVVNFIFVKEDPFLKAYKKKRADKLQQALESN